jgi:hypothetical protein
MADLSTVSGPPGAPGQACVRAAATADTDRAYAAAIEDYLQRADRIARARGHDRITIFAEVLSEVGGVRETCRRIGLPYRTGRRYLARIRAALGAQAI